MRMGKTIPKMQTLDRGSIDYKVELLRKSIHFCSLSIPVIYYFITKELAVYLLVPLTAFAIILDLLRYFHPSISRLFYNIFGNMLRAHEKNHDKKTLNGATFVLISALLTVLIFPKVIGVTAFAILIIGDIFAALIGRRFGKHKFLKKSLEGTTAFFITACIVVLLSPKVEGLFLEYIIGMIGAGVGAIAENLAYGFADDNLVIPISIGFTMWLLYWLLLPGLPLILSGVPN